jgi:hypothetical protein
VRRRPRVFAFPSTPIDTPTLSPFPTLPLAHSLGGNNIRAEGASALAAILKETQITNLECAAAPECLLFCQCPLTHAPAISLPPIPYSLGFNDIGAEGASALAAILKDTQITQLKCAAARVFAFVSMPLDTPDLSPSPLCSSLTV